MMYHIEKLKKKTFQPLGLVKYSKKYLSPEVLAKIHPGLGGPHSSAAPLIQSLGWPTISNLVHKEIATLTYESLNEVAPVQDLITRCSERNGHVLRSTDTDQNLPLLETSAGQKPFSSRGTRPASGTA